MSGRNQKLVLIVEDEAVAALALEDLIEKMGYRVCGPVSSGEEALKEAAGEKPDLVLMDIHINGEMGGLEAASRLSARNIPVIFTTGYYDAEMKKKAAEIKPVAYLVKPLDHEQLRAIICEVFK